MLLLDGSVFSVGPNARLTIDRFVYDPNRNTKTVGASVAKGAFRFMSGRAKQAAGSAIRTPVATIGIRGTIVEGVVGSEAIAIAASESGVGPGIGGDPETASLIILRGPGTNTRGLSLPGAVDVSANGKSVSMNQPMLAVYIPRPGADPIGPFRISQFGLMSVSNLLIPPSPAAIARMERRMDPNQASGSSPANTGAMGAGQTAGVAGGTAAAGGGFFSIGVIAGLVAALTAILVTTTGGDGDGHHSPISP